MAKNNKTTAAERAFNTLYNKKEEDSVSTVAQRAFNSLYNSEYLAQKPVNPYQAAVAQYNNAPITTQKQSNSAVAQFAPVKNRLEAAITNKQKNISPQEYKQYIANNNVTPTQKKAEIREQSKVNNFENAIKTGKITEQDLKNAFGNIDDVRNDIKNEQINTYENIKKTDPRAASAYINQPRNIISEADQRRALTLQKLEALGVDSKLAESYYLNQDLAKKDYGLMSDSEKEQLKNEYESLGQSNVVQRYFADDSIQNKKNYNRQQELYENYRKLKEDEAYNKLLNTGMKPEELDAIGSYTTYESDIKELEKQGYSEEEIEKYAQDKIDRYEAAQKKLYNIVSNLKDNDLSFEDYMNLIKDRYDDPALRRDAEEHAVGNSLFTLATNPVDSTFSALANAGNFITGRPMRDYNTYTDITRDTVTENIDNRFGQIAYGGAMSIGDMAVAAGLAYATGGGSIVSAGVQALEKAAQVMDEGIGRNLTPEQIIAEGIGSGVTTFITEKIPMGKLSKIADEGLTNYSVKEIAKTLGAMMASEGFQEASEDAADWIMDYIVAWDKNEFSADIQKYIDQGYSKEEATKKVIADRGVEMLTDAIIGGIGGGVMGGAGTVLAYSTGKYQTSPSVQTDLVMQSDEALAQLIQAVQTLDPQTAEDSERVEHAIEVSQKDADNLTVEDVVDMANVLNEQANGENNLAQTIQEINYQANYENNINEYRETGRISEKENELPIEKAAREQAQLAVEGYNKAVEAQQKQAQKDFINDLKSYKKNDWQSNEDTKAKTLQSLNEASNYFENDTAAKNFVDNYKGQNLRMYAEVSYLAYTAGETGQSFDTFLKNSVEADLMIKHGGVDKGYLKTLFYNGQNVRRTAENTVALKKNENRGLATNLTPDDQLAVFKKAIAKKLGIEVNTNFDNAESRGNFVASLAKLVTNSTSDNEYQTIIHEMFEFARTYNAKGMELVDKTLTDMIVKKKGERSFVDAVNKYKDAYRRAGQSAPEGSDLRSEANKSASEAQDEFINDAISYIFSTDEGIQQLVDYIMSDENTTAQEKVTTIQAIKDWVDHLIQTIKNFLSGHKTEQYGYKYAEELKLKSDELKAISLKLVSVLEDARKNLEAMTETEGKAEEKVAHSIDVREESVQDKINASMTMDQCRDMLKRAFISGDIKDYYEGEVKTPEEWLEQDGAEIVALTAENDQDIYFKYLGNIEGLDDDFTVEDIIKAYQAGTLTGEKATKKETVRLDVSKAGNKNDIRFFAPKDISDYKKLYELANQKITKANKVDVTKARAAILLFAHNKGAAELLGITNTDLNKALRKWGNYSANAREISMRINAGASVENRWTGIENMAWLNRVSVSDAELDNICGDIKGDSSESQRAYIVRTMLALDTHIDYKGLNFVFTTKPDENRASVYGLYSNDNRTITVKYGVPNTIAHEIGHYLDSQWGREVTKGSRDTYLTNLINIDRSYGSEEVDTWVQNFKNFINSIEDSSTFYNSYTMERQEVFARFVARFVIWADKIANGQSAFTEDHFNDKFTQAQFVEFARLLQEKSALNLSVEEKVAHSIAVKEKSVNNAFEIAEDGRLIFTNPEALTDSDWKVFYKEFKKLGYDFDDVEDCKERMTWLSDNSKKYGKTGDILRQDQSDALKKAFGIGEVQEDTRNEAQYKENAKKAEKTFGVTSNFKLAGYLDVNGKLLDFSEGQGYRVQDHREISQVLDLPEDADYSDGLIEFMNEGNIRLQTYGIDIAVAPNKQQKSVLRDFFNSLNGEVVVDYSRPDGSTAGSTEYSEKTASSRILNDIDSYFETGEVPEGNARFSIKVVEGESGKIYENCVVVDKPTFLKGSDTRQRNDMVNYIKNTLAGHEIIVTDENGNKEYLYIAKKNDRVRKDGAKHDHVVLGELEGRVKFPERRRMIVYIDELAQAAKFVNEKSEHKHQWMDENGWEFRDVYFKDIDGIIYKATLNIARGRDRNIIYDINPSKEVDREKVVQTSKDSAHGLNANFKNNDTPKSIEKSRNSIAVTEDNTGRKLSEGQQTYFGKSVIRDKDGRLKVMYHGTPRSGFSTFSIADDGISFFFTDDRRVAAAYSGVNDMRNPDTPMSLNEINEELWNINGTTEEDQVFKSIDGKIEYWEDGQKTQTFDSLRDAQNWYFDEFINPMAFQGESGPSNYEVYLNAENPLIVEAHGGQWNAILRDDFAKHFENVEISNHGDGTYFVNYDEVENWHTRKRHRGETLSEAELKEIFGYGIDESQNVLGIFPSADGRRIEIGTLYLDKEGHRLPSTTREYAKYAKDNGHDGVVFNDIIDSGFYDRSQIKNNVVVVFNSNQIKSVYNVNPTKNEDIRHSIDVPFFESFEEIDNKVNLDEKDLQKLVEGISDLDSKVSQKAVDDIAGQIKKQYNSKIDKKRLAGDIMSVFRYLKATGKMSMDDVMFVMSEIARPVLEQMETTDEVQKKLYKDFVDTVKNYKISLDAGQTQEVVNAFGSYYNFVNAMRGKLQISKEGTPLDNVWTEICDKSGGALSYGTNPNDQPVALADYINSLNPVAQELEGQDLESASTDLALEIFRQFYVYQSMADAALKVKGEITKRANEAKERYKKKYNEAIKEVEREKALNAQRLAEEIDSLTADEQETIRRGDTVNQALIENLKADYAKRLENLKAQSDEKIAKAKAQYQNSWINKNLRRQTSELKNRLLREVKALQNMIAHPAEGASKHVPVSLINPTIEMLEAINLDNGGRNKAIADRLKKMAEVYESFKNDPNYAFDYDERIASDIEELQEMFARRSYADLSVAELQRVLEIVGALKTQIKNANNLILQDKLADARAAATEAMDQVKGSRRHDNAAMNALNAYGNLHLNAYREFRKLSGYRDGALMDIYNDLDEGSRREMQIQKDLGQIFQDVLEGQKNQKEVKKFISTKDEDLVDIGITDKNGKPIKITRAMRMSLIMHSMNSGNMRHVLGSGITIPNMYYFAKGKLDEAYAKGTNYRFVDYAELLDAIQRNDQNKVAELTTKAQERVEALKKDLSAWEKKFLKDAEKMFHDETGKLINETSMKLKGYAIARVKNYFPIRTDRHFTKQEWAGLVQDASLEGMGMLKERVISSKPILLEDITNVIQRQIRSTAKYAGLAVPVRNFETVMKQTMRDQNDGQLHNLYETIDNVWGSSDSKWLKNLMQDIQGGRQEADSPLARFLMKLRGNFAAATLTTNLGVAIKQAASYPTAAAVVGWKHLIRNIPKFGKGFTGKGIKELEEINPLLWYREQGYGTQDLADAKSSDIMKKMPPALQKALGWTQLVDTGTVRTLEYVAKSYVDDNFTNLEQGSEEYWQKVSDVFTSIVEETQPNYSKLQQADIIRNPNTLNKLLVMFKTQPLQNFGIIYDSMGELNAAIQSGDATWKKEASSKAAKAISSQIVSASVFSAMTFVANLLKHRTDRYKDDDDEWSWEKILREFGLSFVSSLVGGFIAGSFIYEGLSFIFDKITNKKGARYYGLEISAVETINDIVTKAGKIASTASSAINAKTTAEKELALKNSLDTLTSLSESIGEYAGVPVRNIKLLLLSMYYYSMDAIQGIKTGEFKVSSDRDMFDDWEVKTQYERIYEAFLNGDGEAADKYTQELINKSLKENKDALKGGETTEDAIIETVKNDIVDKFKDIIKSDLMEGDITEEEAEQYLVDMTDKTEDEAYYQIKRWEGHSSSEYQYAKDIIDEAASDPTPENRAKVIKEIEGLVEHGKKKDGVRDSLKGTFKDEYVDLYNQGKAADLNSILRTALVTAGYTDEEAKEILAKWLE